MSTTYRVVVVTEASMVLYGHTARIWDAMIIPTGVVSVGEVKNLIIVFVVIISLVQFKYQAALAILQSKL